MINGVLVVNKPQGYTSRDVVNIVGKLLHTKKIGHTGTLDPIATGVLALTIGSATKLSELLVAEEKEYIAEAILGLETDTLDSTGNILKEENTHFSKEEVEAVLTSFVGTYEQEVPIYSAVKINGKKLYEYARKGETIELPKRSVTIQNITLLTLMQEQNKTKIIFSCRVSKGTYIRSLIRDIALSLNTVGIMSELQRIRQGEFSIEKSYSLEEIASGNYHILSILELFSKYRQVEVDSSLEFKIRNGSFLKDIYGEEYILFKKKDALALYKKEGDVLKPSKMFLEN